MNYQYKAYFLDLDGTLLDKKNDFEYTVSQENLIAIKTAQKNGVRIIISTGRVAESVDKYFDLIRPDFAVTGNGALILNKQKKVLKSLKLSIRDNIILLNIIRDNKLIFKFDGSHNAYGTKTFLQRKMCQKFGFLPIKNYSFPMHETYFKFVIWGSLSKVKIKKVTNEIKSQLPHLEVVNSANNYTIEITAKGANKGLGNEFVWKKIGLKKSETVHVGDSMNDSTTIDHVGKLIVLENASKALKKLSPYRGPHYKKQSVVRILNGEISKINTNK